MGRPRKNPLIAATQITAPQEGKPKEWPERKDVRELLGLSAEVAGDMFYIRNTRIPNAATHFPTDPLKRTVDKYFGDAKGGPLYIDEPVTESDIEICKEKAAAMAKEGVRYAYIAPDMELKDVLAQLEPEAERGVA